MRWLKCTLLTLLLLPVVLLLLVTLLPNQLLARQLSSMASSSSGLSVEISQAEVSLFSLSPTLTLTDVQISDAAEVELAIIQQLSVISKPRAIFSSKPFLDSLTLQNASVSLTIDAQGRSDWARWIASLDSISSVESEQSRPLPAVRTIAVNDVQVHYNNRLTKQAATLVLDIKGSTQHGEKYLAAKLTADINQIPVMIDLSSKELKNKSNSADGNFIGIESQIRLGSMNIIANGRISDSLSLETLDLDMQVQGESLDDLASFTAIALPEIPAYTLTAAVQHDGSEWLLRRFDATIGKSDLQGDIRLNLSTSPPTVYANIISTELVLDDLMGIVGVSSRPDLTASTKQMSQRRQLLPDKPIELIKLASFFNGAVEFKANKVKTHHFPIDSIDSRFELLKGNIQVRPLVLGLAGGSVEGSLDIDTSVFPVSSTLELDIKRLDLRKVMAFTALGDQAYGHIAGRAKVWILGDSIASMAASADGGMFILMSNGRVDALLTELAGLDLLESAALLAVGDDASAEIRCAYADLHSKKGVMSLQTFIVDTEDTVFLASGQADFNNESLDLIIEPHPKDMASLAVKTAFKVTGTFAEPAVLPDVALPLGIISSSLLSAVGDSATALLPFLNSGSNVSDPHCEEISSALAEIRR